MHTPAGQRRRNPATVPDSEPRGQGGMTAPHRSQRNVARTSGAISRAGGLVRGLTGSLAAGLLVLAVALGGVQWWASAYSVPGPGIGVVIGHFVASGAALALQAVADRRRDAVGGFATLGAFGVVVAALVYWWWL